MKPIDNAVDTVSKTRRAVVRVTGILFLLAFVGPTLNFLLVHAKLTVPDNVLATAQNILAHERLLRMGMIAELLVAAALVVLAVMLYTLLAHVNRPLALLALTLKAVEASLAAAIVLLTVFSLHLATLASYTSDMTRDQLMVSVGVAMNDHKTLFAVPMVFLGLDMTVFFYLFLASGDLPRWLARFGMVSFVFVLIHALMSLVAPSLATSATAQIIFYTPSCVVEIVVGIWLLTRGVGRLGEKAFFETECGVRGVSP